MTITVKYCNSIVDEYGYIHSIDNVIMTWYLKCSVEIAINEIRELKNKYLPGNYWERLNCSACQKWSWYQNHIHVEDGIYVSLGRYKEYDKKEDKQYIFPMIKLEVNPNKHYDKPIYNGIVEFVRERCDGGYIDKHDYAIDVPFEPDRVKVYGSRKEPGLYKGTRYWGQRNKHGYLRIYDKQKESGLESCLTRIEHTLCNSKPVSFENVCITKFEGIEADLSALDPVNRAIVEMIVLLKRHNEDYEECIKDLNYRRRKKIEPFIAGNIEKLEYNNTIHKQLLDNICKVFDLTEHNVCESVLSAGLSVDDEGFLSVSDEIDLVFV